MPTTQRRPGSVLIRTKLTRPPARAGLVERARLVERMDEALTHRVTLVSAPPGFGKSTLGAQWLDRHALGCAWLALDAYDRDPERFVTYLVAAVETATPHRLPETVALLAARTPPPFAHVAEVLVSELAHVDTPTVVVLEDYHAIGSEDVHRLVERLVPAMPPALHLVVLTRVDPPWPLGRWRAQEWLLELRARDLRFSLEEAQQFFAAASASGLSLSIIEQVHARAEGWVTGLRLLELALRDAPDREARARSFSGSDRLVADYLVGEVVAAQPPEIRTFLAVTAPLPRFSASLADHLLAGGPPQPPAREILARLEQLNLFLVPLDTEGQWYRYHHLFRELLHHIPDMTVPERRADINRRAAGWFAREGLIEEALRHWIEAGDLDTAASCLGEHLGAVIDEDFSRRGLSRLLALFPPGAEHGRLPLLVAHVYIKGSRWDLPGLAALNAEIEEIVRATAGWPRSDADAFLKAAADVHWAGMAFWQGKPQEAVRIASEVLTVLPRREWEFARSVATAYKTVGLAASGRKDDGLKELERAIAGGSAGDRRQVAEFLLAQGLIHLCAAQMDMVETVARRMLAAHEVAPVPEFWLGWAHYLRGVVAYERDQMDRAEEAFRQVEAKRYLVTTRLVHDALVGLCLVARARADHDGATRRAADVRAYALEVGDPTSFRMTDSLDARLAQPADGGSAFESPPPPDFMSFWLEVPSVTYADRLLHGPTRELQDAALSFIERALEQADRHHHVRQSIPFSLLRAEALASQGQQEAALEALAATVRRAEPLGLVRTFLDRGPGLMALVGALAERDGRRGYLARLLAAFETGPDARASEQDGRPAAPAADQVAASDSQLSNREIDVLELLSVRLTNKEIAARLGISPETVRVHTRNLYQKLDVHGRREAVAAARARGLITP